MPSANYRTILRTPGATAFFLAATVGRVGIAMTGVGIVWLVHARTGSYGAAGLVTGGFAVADAVAGTQLARLVDRFGQTRTLPLLLLAHAGAVTLLLTQAVPDLLAGTLVGATLPQLSAMSAARWSAQLSGTRAAELPSAFALEALANGLSFLAGPALASALGAAGRPRLATLVAATLVIVGGLALAAQRRTAPPVAGAAERHRAGRALLHAEFARLVAIALALGVYFGAMQISITAYAVGRGTPDLATLLYAASNCTSLLGGWAYGSRRWAARPARQRFVAAAALTVACLPLTVLDAAGPVVVSLALTGLVVPVLLVLASLLTEAAVPRAVLTQAFTWLNSASAAGSAVAAALAGRAVDSAGAHGGFTVAAAAAVGMTVVAAAGSGPLSDRRSRAWDPGPRTAPASRPPRAWRRGPARRPPTADERTPG